MPTPELSPKTVDALAVAGKRMFETGVHPLAPLTHQIFGAILDGYREADVEAQVPKAWEDHEVGMTKAVPLSEYEQRGFGQRLSEAKAAAARVDRDPRKPDFTIDTPEGRWYIDFGRESVKLFSAERD